MLQPTCQLAADPPVTPFYTHTMVAMDTLVTLRVDTAHPAEAAYAALQRASAWFAVVEQTCSRFDAESELVRLAEAPGKAVPVSPLLFEAVAFALTVARRTCGAFDPTVGRLQQRRGFDRNYITDTPAEVTMDAAVSGRSDYRDVRLHQEARAITLRKPLLLDLGAVAKGLAIDLAARELVGFERYAVDAGGDLYAGGDDRAVAPWRVGIRAPCAQEDLIAVVAVMNAAVCTSGGEERPAAEAGEHHLLDPRTGRSPHGARSVTVIAPTALVADALATAAFVLGPLRGRRLLEEQGLAGLIVTDTGERQPTRVFQEQFGR